MPGCKSPVRSCAILSESAVWVLSYNGNMRRWLSIVALSFILIALPVWAQRRGGGSHGGGGGAHFASRGGSSVHSSISGGFHGGSFGRASGIHIRPGTSNHNHRGFYGRRRYYPNYYSEYSNYYPDVGYYPYGFYGWDDDPLAYDDSGEEDQDAYASYQAPSYPTPYPENSGLRRDVQTLNGKVDRLQAQVQARNRPEPDAEPETALVFRDQHVEEVRNYAISGGAVWVLHEQAAKKIPLVNLDIAATVKMNEDRGVDFQVPEPALQIMIER